MKTHKALLAVLMLPAMLFGALKFYEVIPHQNYIGTAPEHVPISQTFINVVDSLEKVSIWVGDVGNGARYHVQITDLEDNLIASGDSSPGTHSWAWLDVPVYPYQNRIPVRGRTYRAVFTRAEGAPISYAYDPTNPYPYGEMSGDHVPNNWDLAARVHGVMDTIGADWFGVNPYFSFDVLSLA